MTRAEVLITSERDMKEQYQSMEPIYKSVQSIDCGLNRVWNQKFLKNCEDIYFNQKS